MPVQYIEENRQYVLDCTAAVWSTDSIHAVYQDASHTYGDLGFLCDVDFVIEDEDTIYLVEYKNASIPGAARPEAFNPSSEGKLRNVGHKYFDSLHFLNLLAKDKPKQFIYVLEYPKGNSTSRLMLRNKLISYLPFAMQRHFSPQGKKLIEDVKVLSIAEWNSDPKLGNYPFQLITHSDM